MGSKLATAFTLALTLAVPAGSVPAASRGPAPAGLETLDSAGLKSIAAWLKESGRDGYLAADVADAAGIPRAASEDVLEVSQRGFRTGDTLRIAQIPQEEARDFLLFMVQQPGGQVAFYLSTVREGLRKAFISIPGSGAVLPLEGEEARASFQRELSYWQARVAGG